MIQQRYRGVELHSDEEVQGRVRQFAAILLRPFAIAAFFVAVPFYLLVPLFDLHLWSWDLHIVGQAIFALSVGFGLIYGLRGYIIWAGTMLIVTNQRIIDVDRRGIFDRIVSEVPYQSLSDVAYRSKGLIEMTANIGTITFQMYSGNENVSFRNIINPASLHKQILELRTDFLRGTPTVEDPVEGTINRIGTFSPTEQRALLTSLKKIVPKPAAQRGSVGGSAAGGKAVKPPVDDEDV
jgi:hypothetical protein